MHEIKIFDFGYMQRDVTLIFDCDHNLIILFLILLRIWSIGVDVKLTQQDVKNPRLHPYALMFGTEAVLPYEIFLPSLRIQLDQEMSEREHWESLLAQLELLDERCLRAAEHVQVYQKRLSKFYQKK